MDAHAKRAACARRAAYPALPSERPRRAFASLPAPARDARRHCSDAAEILMAARPDVTVPAQDSAGTVQVRLRVALLAECRLPAAQEIFAPLVGRQPDVQHPAQQLRVFALQEMSDGLARSLAQQVAPGSESLLGQAPHQALPQSASRVSMPQAQLQA
jgi:hypothetical protein